MAGDAHGTLSACVAGVAHGMLSACVAGVAHGTQSACVAGVTRDKPFHPSAMSMIMHAHATYTFYVIL